MTKRNPVASKQNIWFDAQQVDDTDLTLEQDHNDTIESGIINNHIGTGVLPEVLVQNVIFDSLLANGFLDGIAIQAQNQPVDNNLGNQLELELTHSIAASRRAVKVGIIGLDFESNLQYETFYFKANETQVSRQHFTKILVLLFNDFIGDPDLSFNLGGRLVIREAKPMTLSRGPVMVAQDIEPNLFFRDFFLDGPISLQALLQGALPLYNIDTLEIFTAELDNKPLLNGDVTTQIGQKFLATTNNIQKAQLLLSVRNLDVGNESDLVWNGDLVVSIYPLQSNIDCPSDIAPNLPIDFPPFNIPVAQISVNYSTLRDAGVVLDSVPQPVDFVFSNSPVAAGNVLIPGSYYAVTIRRSGSANKCDILVSVGTDRVPDSRITTFTGSLWVDIPEQDLWFRIWTDAAKVSDGQAYEAGHGMIVPKTHQDPTSLATVDFSLEGFQFTGNDVFRAVVAADVEESVPVPDQRTGNPVLSRKEFVPDIQLLNTIDITNLEKVAEPLLLGAISDKNRKFFDSISALINSTMYSATMVNDELIIRIVDDPTDVVRFNTSVGGLVTNLLNGDFVGAKIAPNAFSPTINYRIASAQLASGILGDVNGDGIIDAADLDLLTSYYGMDLNVGLPTNTIITTDGYTTTFKNGYNTLTQPFANLFGVSFQLVDPATNEVVANGNDGVLVAHPNDPRLAQFTSASISFNVIVGLSSFKLVIFAPFNQEDNGGFDITALDSDSDVLTLRKVYLTGDSIMNMLRADIDGDLRFTFNDGYLLHSYIDRLPLSLSPVATFPGPATNAYTKIGTRFNVLRFRLEQYIDRTDDYTAVTIDRSEVVHPTPDIFLNDGYFDSHDFYVSPVPITIQKQLTWDESLIVSNSHPKLVPSVFTTLNGYTNPSCIMDGVNISIYGSVPDFDKGRVDFFAPDNVIIGTGGEIHRPDGNFYKVDFEVGTIILEIPDGLFGSERTINIMDDFISDYTGDGRTRLGFPAMRYADCSFVKADALAEDKIRFSVSVQSFSPNTNGLSTDGYAGVIVDGKIGLSIDYKTGLLTMNFTNLFQDPLLRTLSTKVQIHVYLKKGGFNNRPLFVDATKVQNMLKLISVFSGAVDGGPSALVDLEFDVTGVLPILHGGTGLNDVGTFGTVLTSTGSGLNYQFVYDLVGVIPFSTGIPDANRVPKTDGYGLLDPSFYYKNPIYIYGSAGTISSDSSTPVAIGAFQFRFDKYILQGLQDIKLEVIIETTNVADTARIQLYNVNTATYLNLVGFSQYLTTTSTSAIFLASDDIKTQMSIGATDFVYEIHLSLNPTSGTDTAICKMARLVMTYDNPYGASPPIAHSWNFVPYLPSPDPI
jgi:hypothetical protein